MGIYPAVDPLESTSRILDPKVVGEEHYKVARGVQEILQKYKELQDIIAILGMDELSEDEKLVVEIFISAILRSRTVYRKTRTVCIFKRYDPGIQRNLRRKTR